MAMYARLPDVGLHLMKACLGILLFLQQVRSVLLRDRPGVSEVEDLKLEERKV